jgi:hypothetical protein
MMGFMRKLWRRHRVKARDRRMFIDQEHQASHGVDDAPVMPMGVRTAADTSNLRPDAGKSA